MGKFFALLFVVIMAFMVIDYFEPHGYGVFSKVSNGNIAVVTRFGKAHEEPLDAGFHLKNYFDVLNTMSIQTQSLPFEFYAFSKDIQQVYVQGTINFNIDKTNAVTLFRDVGKNYTKTLIEPRNQENTKIVFSDYTAEQLVTQREELSVRATELMKEELLPFGINVTSVNIEDIDFTDAFTNAVEAKQVATQERLTAQTMQERMTMEAEAEAHRKTIAASADAEVAKIQADAKAYEIKVQADAEAEANEKIADSLTDALIEYGYANAWDGRLPVTYMGEGSAVPVISAGETE